VTQKTRAEMVAGSPVGRALARAIKDDNLPTIDAYVTSLQFGAMRMTPREISEVVFRTTGIDGRGFEAICQRIREGRCMT